MLQAFDQFFNRSHAIDHIDFVTTWNLQITDGFNAPGCQGKELGKKQKSGEGVSWPFCWARPKTGLKWFHLQLLSATGDRTRHVFVVASFWNEAKQKAKQLHASLFWCSKKMMKMVIWLWSQKSGGWVFLHLFLWLWHGRRREYATFWLCHHELLFPRVWFFFMKMADRRWIYLLLS